MTIDQARELLRVMDMATRERKRSYRAYELLKGNIQSIGLLPKEYEQAVQKLAKTLKV